MPPPWSTDAACSCLAQDTDSRGPPYCPVSYRGDVVGLRERGEVGRLVHEEDVGVRHLGITPQGPVPSRTSLIHVPRSHFDSHAWLTVPLVSDS